MSRYLHRFITMNGLAVNASSDDMPVFEDGIISVKSENMFYFFPASNVAYVRTHEDGD